MWFTPEVSLVVITLLWVGAGIVVLVRKQGGQQ